MRRAWNNLGRDAGFRWSSPGGSASGGFARGIFVSFVLHYLNKLAVSIVL